MWILPSGYSFLLQAGSAGNDTFPTVYALAAVDFGCRAWKSRSLNDLWLSGLAAALLVGAKASNLPLLLPWGLVVLPLVPLLKKRPAMTVALALVAALVSFLPTAILNIIYCHDWSGLNLERTGMNMKNPIVGIWGNMLLFFMANFAPPFFPLAGWWNQHALTILPQALVRPMVANFEAGFETLGELPIEDTTGIGFGISMLVAVSVLGALICGRKAPAKMRAHFNFAVGARPSPGAATSVRTGAPQCTSAPTNSSLAAPGDGRSTSTRRNWLGVKTGHSFLNCPKIDAIPPLIRWCGLIGPWIALLAFCMKSGMVTGARLISPYYPLLLPLLLVIPGSQRIVRSKSWRVLAWANFLLAAAVLIVTPGRPLWPAETILSKLHTSHPASRAIARALNVYDVYAVRWDPLANVRALLPPNVKTVGFMGAEDDLDISLWRPFGHRRVEHVLPSDSLENIRERHLEYIVIGGFNLKLKGTTLETWLNRIGGRVIATTSATVKVAEGQQPWYLVRVDARTGRGN